MTALVVLALVLSLVAAVAVAGILGRTAVSHDPETNARVFVQQRCVRLWWPWIEPPVPRIHTRCRAQLLP